MLFCQVGFREWLSETGARLGDAIDLGEATGLLQAVDGRGANFTFACLWAQQRPSRFSVNWPLTARCQSAKRCASRGLARVVFRFVEGGTVPTSVAGTPRGFGASRITGTAAIEELSQVPPRCFSQPPSKTTGLRSPPLQLIATSILVFIPSSLPLPMPRQRLFTLLSFEIKPSN